MLSLILFFVLSSLSLSLSLQIRPGDSALVWFGSHANNFSFKSIHFQRRRQAFGGGSSLSLSPLLGPPTAAAAACVSCVRRDRRSPDSLHSLSLSLSHASFFSCTSPSLPLSLQPLHCLSLSICAACRALAVPHLSQHITHSLASAAALALSLSLTRRWSLVSQHHHPVCISRLLGCMHESMQSRYLLC